MAHEIKNPLTPILLSAQRLRNRFMETLTEKDLQVMDKTTNIIIDQVGSLNQMVSAFANYATAPKIKRHLIDLNALIRQSLLLYEAQKQLEIELDLAKDLPKILLDSHSISRVLINLIKNSIEAKDKKSPTVQVKICTYSDALKVYLSIEDNGKGFTPDMLSQVFEPYATSKAKGSGLGMSIVQTIIEQHNGSIEVANISPQGAKINIEFTR
jgi:nitrogen fixation/metabolism regulation signal transduction histidine kinase